MEITPEKLVQIIGSLQVEIFVLRGEIERLRAEAKSNENVTPIKQPAS